MTYPVAVTPDMSALIDASDPTDPIARQFLPALEEQIVAREERADPIGDAPHSPVKGLVHRHPDRVLFKPVMTCAVYCRFCFRREEVGAPQAALSPRDVAAALDYVRGDRAIREVIFTGGDPFVLSPRRIGELSAAFANIDHVRFLRWHTRVPVVDPERVSDELAANLIVPGATTYVALHANHPREFTPAARAAIARLIDAGVTLVSQSVLLKGVNDDVTTLEALMCAFLENRIKPYYLHHPDLAPGTGHFRLDIGEGQALMRALSARLSGLALPNYVLDIPGGFAKVSLLSDNVQSLGGGRWCVRDHEGRWHLYPPE